MQDKQYINRTLELTESYKSAAASSQLSEGAKLLVEKTAGALAQVVAAHETGRDNKAGLQASWGSAATKARQENNISIEDAKAYMAFISQLEGVAASR